MSLTSLEIDESHLDEYLLHARDAAFAAGLSSFASKNKNDPDYETVKFLPYTLLPSPFPRSQFEYAVRVQGYWNELMHLVANNHEIIKQSLQDIIKKDEFFAKLWYVYISAMEESKKQSVTLNIMRCDYFLDKNKLINLKSNKTALSQVEFNTLGCGGTAIPTKVVELRKYLLKKMGKHEYIDRIAPNEIYENVCQSLLRTWRLYGNPESILIMIVSEKHYLYRLIEYRLLELEPMLCFTRATLAEFHNGGARVDGQNKLFFNNREVGLVYYIAGFDPTDYPSENEWKLRLMIEQSRAIKAPKIEYQLIDCKKFQQFLFETDTLEILLKDPAKVSAIRDTFVKQYSFGQGKNNKELIEMMKNNYQNLVLKPQREGGGNNIFNENIKNVAESIKDETELYHYVLMERIRPVEHYNYLIRQFKPVERLKVATEIGIFGISITGPSNELIYNEYGGGFTFNTKDASLDEGGIIAGYAAYDTLFYDDFA